MSRCIAKILNCCFAQNSAYPLQFSQNQKLRKYEILLLEKQHALGVVGLCCMALVFTGELCCDLRACGSHGSSLCQA